MRCNMWHPCYSPSERILLNIHDLFTCHFSQHLTEHNKIYFSNCAQILQDHSCWNLLRVTYFTKKTSNSEPTNFLVNTDNYWKIWFSKSDLNGLFIVFSPQLYYSRVCPKIFFIVYVSLTITLLNLLPLTRQPIFN